MHKVKGVPAQIDARTKLFEQRPLQKLACETSANRMHPVSDIDLIEVDLSVPPVRQGHPIRSERSIPCQDLTEKRPLKRVIFKISSQN